MKLHSANNNIFKKIMKLVDNNKKKVESKTTNSTMRSIFFLKKENCHSFAYKIIKIDIKTTLWWVSTAIKEIINVHIQNSSSATKKDWIKMISYN